jgi:tRNA threonylcarbamoyladenosine biosynthesis protein TsaB
VKILAIDTSSKFLSLGVYYRGRVSGYSLEAGRQLSALLNPAIRGVLQAAGVSLQEIDYFACGLGPGSFTGLRIGIAAVKGLSWALNKRIAGLCSLEALARGAQDYGEHIVAAIDARRNLFYCAAYQKEKGKLKQLAPCALLPLEKLAKLIRPGSVVAGDAAALCRERFPPGLIFPDQDLWYPRPQQLVEMALEKIAQKKPLNAFSIKPVYLYASDCQVKRLVTSKRVTSNS